MKSISLSKAIKQIDNYLATAKGKMIWIRVETKKGTIRDMTLRTGIKHGTTPLKFNPAEKGLRLVTDMQLGDKGEPRFFSIGKVIAYTIEGETFEVKEANVKERLQKTIGVVNA